MELVREIDGKKWKTILKEQTLALYLHSSPFSAIYTSIQMFAKGPALYFDYLIKIGQYWVRFYPFLSQNWSHFLAPFNLEGQFTLISIEQQFVTQLMASSMYGA